MLNALKFVQGAVSKKSLLPTLTHFRIKDGYIMSSNGMLTLCSPIDLDIEATPKADKFMRAIRNCSEAVQLSLQSRERLFIRSGSFKAYIDCTDEPYPEISPEGDEVKLDGGILEALSSLEKFIGEDDSRRWARGILLRGESAFATNNIVLVEKWLGHAFPHDVCIPEPAVQELLRLGEEPESIQISGTSITFHFAGNRWMRTQAYSVEWPPVTSVLAKSMSEDMVEVPEGFFDAISKLKPFVDEMDRVYFSEGRIGTSDNAEAGASVSVSVATKGIYNINMIELLNGTAYAIDFKKYPDPCPFIGDNLRGLIMGMKL
jgi:DNA polymerase III sliding clamp (beta) subunit (PCNA family)